MQKKLNVGLIGLGGRGQGLLKLLPIMEQVCVHSICDQYEDRLQSVAEDIKKASGITPVCTTNYRDILADSEIDCVVISTSWETHTRIAKEAMRAGKYTGLEVGGAYDIEDCWELVRTHEETGTHLMMLENCCYGEKELTVQHMVREGHFGKVVHCEAGYEHDLRFEVAGGWENRHYRLNNFLHRCGDLYPTHGLGPIANLLGLNHGNRMVSLTSMASPAAGMKAWIQENYPADSPMQDLVFQQGDITNTMIRCSNGETILLTHGITLPRPYSRDYRVDGTAGCYMENGNRIFLWEKNKEKFMEDVWAEHPWDCFDSYKEDYAHPLWKDYRASGIMGGHGGMDYLVFSAFFEAVEKGVAPPIDVYDAASWMVITCLSEQSIAMGSQPVSIPDFTRGAWMNERPTPKSRYSLDKIHYDLFE